MDDETEKPPVGYKNPPKHSQFKKGQSGNPKGPTKGSKNVKTAWQDAMSQQVTVKENGVPRQVGAFEAAILALKNAAISKGDLRAMIKIIDYSRIFAADEEAATTETKLKNSDQDILQRFLDSLAPSTAKGGDDDPAT